MTIQAAPTRMARSRFTLTALAVSLAGMAWSGSGYAQSNDRYPDRPIRLVVAYGPGGVADLIGRVTALGLTKALGQSVVVENRGGAGGTVGAAAVAAAPPDGYMILLTSPPMIAVAPLLVPGLRYDSVGGFTPIGTVAVTPNILVTNPHVPVQNLADMARYGKAEGKGKLSYATSGPGSTGHLFGFMLQKAMGIEMTHVPYASGNVFPDVIAGRVSMAFDSVPAALGYIQAGQVKPLAIMADKRSSLMPDVPTSAESGYPDAKMNFWLGIEGPAGLPAPIVKKLNDALRTALATPEMRQQLAALGADPFVNSAADFTAMRKQDIAKLRDLAKGMGLGDSN